MMFCEKTMGYDTNLQQKMLGLTFAYYDADSQQVNGIDVVGLSLRALVLL